MAQGARDRAVRAALAEDPAIAPHIAPAEVQAAVELVQRYDVDLSLVDDGSRRLLLAGLAAWSLRGDNARNVEHVAPVLFACYSPHLVDFAVRRWGTATPGGRTPLDDACDALVNARLTAQVADLVRGPLLDPARKALRLRAEPPFDVRVLNARLHPLQGHLVPRHPGPEDDPADHARFAAWEATVEGRPDQFFLTTRRSAAYNSAWMTSEGELGVIWLLHDDGQNLVRGRLSAELVELLWHEFGHVVVPAQVPGVEDALTVPLEGLADVAAGMAYDYAPWGYRQRYADSDAVYFLRGAEMITGYSVLGHLLEHRPRRTDVLLGEMVSRFGLAGMWQVATLFPRNHAGTFWSVQDQELDAASRRAPLPDRALSVDSSGDRFAARVNAAYGQADGVLAYLLHHEIAAGRGGAVGARITEYVRAAQRVSPDVGARAEDLQEHRWGGARLLDALATPLLATGSVGDALFVDAPGSPGVQRLRARLGIATPTGVSGQAFRGQASRG